MRFMIDKLNLAKVIAKKMTRFEEPELFIQWVSRENVTMNDVLRYATEEDIQETVKWYNEL